MRPVSLVARLALAVLLLATAGIPAHAALRALVIGFYAYAFKVSLEGSRNDAADIAAVLRKRGVTDITVIGDPGETRAMVEQAWAAMVDRAKPGDLLFVSFSGHGNRSPETGEPKHTPDGFEKGFLLPLYDEDKHPEEQLRDEHLYDLFKAASDKGLGIVFVADACHAGASVRAVTASTVVPKFQMFQTHGKPLPPPPAATDVVHRPPISGLTVYSAADEKQTIQEFTIDNERRGALSFVLARGLEGAAAEPDGRLTAGDLGRYIVTNVRLRSNNTQIPSATTPQPDLAIFAIGAPLASTAIPDPRPIALFSDRPTPQLVNARPTSDQRTAVLSWTGGSRVLNAHGDSVADSIGPNQLQGALDAGRVREALADLMGTTGGALATNVAAVGKPASDRYYLPGEHIRIEAEASTLRFLTVVDLSGDGTVQFLWPHRQDPLEWTRSDKPNFEVKVTPPFGEDALIFIESDHALTDLHTDLARLDGQVAPTAFYDALKLWLPHTGYHLGIQAVFTCGMIKGDGTCG